MADLRRRADIVLVDAPALLGVADVLTLGRIVDAVLLVCHASVARRRTLDELRRQLDDVFAPALGLALTGAERDSHARPHAARPPRTLRDLASR
jgi:Mrp family chromosome partitioning ATPase